MHLVYLHMKTIFFARFALVMCFVSFLVAGGALSGQAQAETRTISIYNIHTKVTLTVQYKKNGRYIPSAMKKINLIMGDWRRKESRKMDPKLIDLMWEVHNEVGSKKPIYLISGYRSQKTNNLLRKTRGGQARRSRHILGKAADVHFPDVSVRSLRNSAIIKQAGGVGYYPTSAIPFVHLDTGRVRHWPRMSRYELAALFPKGRTRHVPKDGRRITRRDYKLAMVRLNARSKKAAIRSVSLAQIRPATGTRIASLSAPLGISKNGKAVRGAFASWNKEKKAPALKARKHKDKKLLRLASLTPNTVPELSLKKESQPALRSDKESLSDENWVSAPAYDDEHADELSYSPFPVLPLMKDLPVSYDKALIPLIEPEHHKVEHLFGEPTEMIPLRFRHGLQYSQMLWASDFQGKAVNNIMTPKQPLAPKYPEHHYNALKNKKGS